MKNSLPYSILPGIVRGATPAVTPGRWFDANLIRWRGGRIQPIGGCERMTATPLPSTPRRIATWVDTHDAQFTGLGCDSKLLILNGDSVFDATPDDFHTADTAVGAGGYSAALFGAENFGDARSEGSFALARAYSFSLAPWGEDLLALASFDGRLMRWTPTAPTTKAAYIANAPGGARAAIVTDQRHVVLIGHDSSPREIAWCSREDYNDWDFASVTNTAGFLPMNTKGMPVAAVKVREGVLIFTEIDVWLLRFIGSPYVYSLDMIAETTTLLSPNAIATFGGKAVWLGREGFFLYDGGSVKSLPCDVAGFLFDDMDPLFRFFRTHAAANGSFPEIWWHYPSIGAQECDRYVAWNYEEGWWTIGRMGRTAMLEAGVGKFPVMAAPDNHLYQHESGWTDAGVPRTQSVFVGGPTLRLGDGARQMTVTSLFPDTGGDSSAAAFTFTVRDAPDGAPRTAGPYVTRADGYMDARFTGRDVQLRISGLKDALWTVGQPILEVKPRGKR